MPFKHFENDPRWHRAQIVRAKRLVQAAKLRHDRAISDSKEADVIIADAKAGLQKARRSHRESRLPGPSLDVQGAENFVRKAVANAELWEGAISTLLFEVERAERSLREAEKGLGKCLRRAREGRDWDSEEEAERAEEERREEQEFEEEERRQYAKERQQRRDEARAYATGAGVKGHVITRAGIVAFHQKAKEALADYGSILVFPDPPSEPCGNVSCAATAPTRALRACRCNIMRVFFGISDLKKVRRSWHPDRFSAEKPEVREEYKKKAGEIFVVLSEMIW
ncbi:hypothetical protein LTR86_002448 [Recurvomyces mirabilis]|nr:hypothetical protein LTR86_002448 [Recurvomyces mirabilis]